MLKYFLVCSLSCDGNSICLLLLSHWASSCVCCTGNVVSLMSMWISYCLSSKMRILVVVI